MASTTAEIATARPLTPAEEETLTAIRARAISSQHGAPYLAYALFRLRPFAAPGLDTMAVDDAGRVYIDFAAVERWGIKVSTGVYIHEMNHVLRRHGGRRGTRNPQAWNLATDAEINDGLQRDGFPLPNPVLPAHLGQQDDLTAEEYYAGMVNDEEAGAGASPDADADAEATGGVGDADGDHAGDHPGRCGGGSGVTGDSAPWELPRTASHDALEEVELEAVRRVTAEKIRQMEDRQRGSVPGDLVDWAVEELRPPRIPWQQMLRAQVRHSLTMKAGTTHHDWRRPSRRNDPTQSGYLLPGTRSAVPNVAVAVDTSGSMSSDDLVAALSEVEGVLRTTRSRVQGFAVDVRSTRPVPLATAKDLHISGRGGTDMREAFATFDDLKVTPDVVVLCTDCATPWPTTQPAYRTVVVAVGRAPHHRDVAAVPDWAVVVCTEQD